MGFDVPSRDELRGIAADLGLALDETEVDDYREILAETLSGLERLQDLPEPQFQPHDIAYPNGRDGYRPEPDEDPHNAWITKCSVEGASDGPLSGTTIGLKDNVSLAGVEMTCGTHLLDGYVPTVDATVVRRLLDAGATIEGKLNMESFGFSTSSNFTDYGTVTNPYDDAYIAGGSSSGSGVAPAIGEVDIAIGCDQGASIRVPASCCGIVGLDPTTGLVPYTGIVPMDTTIDHVGPMAMSVEDVATTLDVIAGRDGFDPRQPVSLDPGPYTDALHDDVEDVTIAVLTEGTDPDVDGCETSPDIAEIVEGSLEAIEGLGASIERTSVPMHADAATCASVVWSVGSLRTYENAGQETMFGGWYDTHLMEEFKQRTQASDNELLAIGKTTLMVMEFLDRSYPDPLYGKAQNFGIHLREKYDDVLEDADAIALPTMPTPPYRVDETNSLVERVLRTVPLAANTAPFTLTGHPALSVPVGTVDGLPVGLQLVGSHFDEGTLLRIAHALEVNVEWPSPPST